VSWKLSSTVLRGGTDGNAGSLLDSRTERAKQPFHFGMGDDSLFAFVGLWDRWRDPSGQVVESCSILTTTPNALLADVHDRMPVILSPEHYDWWLDPGARCIAVTLPR
jgi:putative SOS response-associated peptidase YedK